MPFLLFLDSLDFQLDVCSIHVDTFGLMIQILPFLKPTRLEDIKFADALNSTADEFDEIAETEQWKRAKRLKLDALPEWIQADQLLQFKEIKVFQLTATDKNVMLVRDILLQSSHLELCTLARIDWDRLDDDLNRSYLENEPADIIPVPEEEDFEERIDSIMRQHHAYNPHTGRFSIPNSREYFQFTFYSDDDCKLIDIKRMRDAQNSENGDHAPGIL